MRSVLLFLSILLTLNCTIFAQNNIGIGTATPHSSARLDITATDKGILIPRVSLIGVNNTSPIASPAVGLLVWNTNFGFLNGVGFNYWDGSGWQSLLTGQKGWRLTGNLGTNPTNDFIGTTDDVEFTIKVNNNRSGFIDQHNKNLFLGYRAGENNTSGFLNTFLGDSAGFSHTQGFSNTFVGGRAGMSTTAVTSNNSFFGKSAGERNESGTINTFVGAFAGFSIQTGDGNTFVGYSSGGGDGSNNTALGHRASIQGTSSNATAIGTRASTNCSDCIILGSVDGINGATSSVNVGIGLISPLRPLHISGSPTTTGINPNSDAVMVVERNGGNAYISMLTDNDRSSGINFGNQFSNVDGGIYYNFGGTGFDLRFRTNGNATRMTIDSIGRVGIGTTTPDFQLELSQNSAAKPTSSAWTVASDLRLKENVFAFTDGLSTLQEINPVWFTYNGEAGLPKETGVGTIAQELKLIAPYMIKEWTGKDDKGNAQQYLGVDYGPMQFILINAIKEQQQIIEQQQKELSEYKKMMLELLKRVDALEKAK